MARSKAAEQLKETAINTLDRFVGEIPPADLLILAGGFMAGTQGYTPLSAIVGAAGQGNLSGTEQISKARVLAKQKLTGEQLAYAENTISQFDFITAFGMMFGNPATAFSGMWATEGLNYGLSKLPDLPENTAPSLDQIKAAKEYILLTMIMGITGMIESYVITRPGTIAGIGEIVKGIGEMIPG